MKFNAMLLVLLLPLLLSAQTKTEMKKTTPIKPLLKKTTDTLPKIELYAGSGKTSDKVNFGDDGPAIEALFFNPMGIVFDKQGNSYVSDRNHDMIRKINKDGIITRLGGNYGRKGSVLTDGVPATAASLFGPNVTCIDSKGNFYVIAENDNSIRKISTDGMISTFAGQHQHSNKGDQLGDGGPASKAVFGDVDYIYIDSKDNMYIADNGYHIIRKIDNSGTITTIAGIGEVGFSGDNGPATDAALGKVTSIVADDRGNLYINDLDCQRIRKISPDGVITSVAGNCNCNALHATGSYGGDGGPAINAGINFTNCLAIDKKGDLVFSDNGNNRIRMITRDGIISTIFAGKTVKELKTVDQYLGQPNMLTVTSMAFDNDDNLYVVDRYYAHIFKIVSNNIKK